MLENLAYLAEEKEPLDMEVLMETAVIAFALVIAIAMVVAIFFYPY